MTCGFCLFFSHWCPVKSAEGATDNRRGANRPLGWLAQSTKYSTLL